MTLAARIERGWWRRATGIVPVLLAPLAGIFAALAALRRWLYRRGWLACMRLPVPVVVVGNIAVGGTGKTPLTLALAEALRERGFTPGIVSRGYGRRASVAQEVTPASTWREVGDEPLVLARSGVPVWVGAKRAIAASSLLAAQRGVDVIVSDDGLQHYALARDFEIAVVDSQRGVGNGRLLPAGPLREPVSRLASVDAIVVREAVPGTAADDPPDAGAKDGRGLAPASLPFDMAGSAVPCYAMHYEAQAWRNLVDEAVRLDAGSLGSARPGAESPGDVVAIAGIADPEAFFAEVAARGIRAHARAFPDHHAYRRQELAFPGARAILMTEKDAVKCREFGDARMWFLPIRAVADPALVGAIVEKLRGSEAARDARLPGDQGTADP